MAQIQITTLCGRNPHRNAGLAAAFNAPLAGVMFALEELCHSKPIYEELLNRSLGNSKPSEQTLHQRNIAELSVCSGSQIEGKLVKDVHWPANTLLVEIKRGETTITPVGDTKIMAGDFLYILTENENIQKLTAITGEQE